MKKAVYARLFALVLIFAMLLTSCQSATPETTTQVPETTTAAPETTTEAEKKEEEMQEVPMEELNVLPGVYSGSDFVRQTVGTDNVCERAAVLASGGSLIEEKFACGGVTFALAAASPTLDWRF